MNFKKILTTAAIATTLGLGGASVANSQSVENNPDNNKKIQTEILDTTKNFKDNNFNIAVDDSTFRSNTKNYVTDVVDLTGAIASCNDSSMSNERHRVARNIIRANDLSSKEVLVNNNYEIDFTSTGLQPDTVFVSDAINIDDLTHLEYRMSNDSPWQRTSITANDVKISPGAYLRQHEDIGTFIEMTKDAPTQNLSFTLSNRDEQGDAAAVRLVYNNINLLDELKEHDYIALHKDAYQNILDTKAKLRERNEALEISLYDLNNQAQQLANEFDDLTERYDYVNEKTRNWVVSPSLGALTGNDNYFALANLSGGLSNGVELALNYAHNMTENPSVTQIPKQEQIESVTRPFGTLNYVDQTFGEERSTVRNSIGASLLLPISSGDNLAFKLGPSLGFSNVDYEKMLTSRQFQEANGEIFNEQVDNFKETSTSKDIYLGLQGVARINDRLDIGLYGRLNGIQDRVDLSNSNFGLTFGYNFGGVKK
ncbi:MAG: hypothetical protein ACMXX7_00700 [Candidatus Woesearchaeota archaeon]